MNNNEVRILLDLLSRLDKDCATPPRPDHRFAKGECELVDRIVNKARRQVLDGQPNSSFVSIMAAHGYPLLPLLSDLFSVRLYGIQTSKGVISFEPSQY